MVLLRWERVAVIPLEECWFLYSGFVSVSRWADGRFQELIENAAEAPHVWSVVIRLDQRDFWRPIPPWTHVGRHWPPPRLSRLFSSQSVRIELFSDKLPFFLSVTDFESLNLVSESFCVTRSWACYALREASWKTEIAYLYLAISVN